MNATALHQVDSDVPSQTFSSVSLNAHERDRLVISSAKVNGTLVTRSLYGDGTWLLNGAPPNVAKGHARIDFSRVPEEFRAAAKELMYLYHFRGREGSGKAAATTLVGVFDQSVQFFRYLVSIKVEALCDVSPMVCATYVAACKAERIVRKGDGKPLSAEALGGRFSAVEVLYEMSLLTNDPMPSHPWPESSAKHLAGLTGSSKRSKTPLIPDDVFSALFHEAWSLVQRGSALLDLRDTLEGFPDTSVALSSSGANRAKNRQLKLLGWDRGVRSFGVELNRLRTACYIVVASLSGCRNHELAHLRSSACYSTRGEEGEVYWWMRGRSDKTAVGDTEWMIPTAAVQALAVMDRWTIPLQEELVLEIQRMTEANPLDPEIAEAQRHVGAVFIGADKDRSGRVRILTDSAWNIALTSFARGIGLNWVLSTHQFRRKFANYAARSRFGDLRYLREHFKHWSQDMTNDAYALNESQEIELYGEILEELAAIKQGVADQWLSPAEPLAGGYGGRLTFWRSQNENIVLFKDRATMVRSVAESHAIRSNGHAWCTADDNRCIGNTFEKTRCSGCDNAVIGSVHAHLYQRLYSDLKDVAKCEDIGQGGRLRVLRDLERCRNVLLSLGHDPDAHAQ